jgi:hypothetical protein
MKLTVFWDVVPYSLVEAYRRFRGACCLHHQDSEGIISLMMEAASTSETLVNFYQITRRNIPEDSLHTRRRENLKSHQIEECSSDGEYRWVRGKWRRNILF